MQLKKARVYVLQLRMLDPTNALIAYRILYQEPIFINHLGLEGFLCSSVCARVI